MHYDHQQFLRLSVDAHDALIRSGLQSHSIPFEAMLAGLQLAGEDVRYFGAEEIDDGNVGVAAGFG